MSNDAEIPPGPNAGRIWRDAPEIRRDPLTGRTVHRLTGYRGHSYHIVGAAPCWLDGGRRLIVLSDREGHGNLFSYDFVARELSQLTDLRTGNRPTLARLSPSSEQLEFWYDQQFYQLEL